MPRKRMIDPKIWTSPDFLGLTVRQRLLFIGLFSNADDRGRMNAESIAIKATVFPVDGVGLDEIHADLQAIQDRDMVRLFSNNNGRVYLQIKNFLHHQYIQKPQKSSIPIPQEIVDDLDFPFDPNYDTLANGTTIPVTEQYGNSNIPLQPKRKEKNRSTTLSAEADEILDYWNSFDELATHGKEGAVWKATQEAVRNKLRGKLYTVDKIKAGIRAYALICGTSHLDGFGDKRSQWTLPIFLSRKNGLNEFWQDPILYVARRTKCELDFCPECGGNLKSGTERRNGKNGTAITCDKCKREWRWEVS